MLHAHDELFRVVRLNARQRLRAGEGRVSIQLSGLSGDPHFATGFTESSTDHPSSAVLDKVSFSLRDFFSEDDLADL